MGVVYEIYQHKISRTEFIQTQQNLMNMCTGKAIEVAHFVAIVSTRKQTINQKSTVQSTLVTWSHSWRCALINSRAARNIFAGTVNGTQIESF